MRKIAHGVCRTPGVPTKRKGRLQQSRWDTGIGIQKLLTGGCCGIMTIIDWFTISKKAKEVNFNRVMSLI